MLITDDLNDDNIDDHDHDYDDGGSDHDDEEEEEDDDDCLEVEVVLPPFIGRVSA